MANLREVVRDLVRFTRVDELAACKYDQLIEEGHDVAAGLVDREDDGTVIVTSEGDEAVNDTQCVVCIEAYAELEEENVHICIQVTHHW